MGFPGGFGEGWGALLGDASRQSSCALLTATLSTCLSPARRGAGRPVCAAVGAVSSCEWPGRRPEGARPRGVASCRGLVSLHLQQPLLRIQRWGRLQVEPTSPRGPRGLLPEPPCALPAAACSARMQGPPRCASRAGPRAGPRAGAGQRVSMGALGAPRTPSLQTPAGSSAEQVGPKPEPHGAYGCVLRRPVACGSALSAGSPCHPEGRVPAEASA